MAKKETQSKAELYREERKARIAKANKQNSKKSSAGAGSAAKRVVAIVLAAVIVLGAAYLIFDSTGAKSRVVTAAKIGDTKISESEFNYYYYSAYQQALQLQENYSQYGMSYIDSSKSPDEQAYPGSAEDENKTWADALVEQAATQAQSVTAFSLEAKKAGLTLTDEEKTQINDTMASIEESAKSNGYSVNAYLKAQFGINKKTLEEQLEKEQLASKFQTSKQEEFEKAVTEEKLKEEYDKNTKDYQLADVRVYSLAFGTDADDAAKKTTVADAKDILKAITDEASFNTAVKAYEDKKAAEDKKAEDAEAEAADTAAAETDAEPADTTLKKHVSYSTLKSTIEEKGADWAFDAKRANGDKTVIEGESGAYVIYVVKKAYNDAHSVTARYCLIRYNEDGGAAANDEEAKAALDKANSLYDEWKKAGTLTEDSFAALCKENSADTSTSEDGGLIDVRFNQTISAFEDWCFAEGRKAGDTAVVPSDEYGVFILYFVSDNKDDLDWKATAKSSLSSNSYSEFCEKLLADDGEYKITDYAKVENAVSKEFCKNIKRNLALNSIYG